MCLFMKNTFTINANTHKEPSQLGETEKNTWKYKNVEKKIINEIFCVEK